MKYDKTTTTTENISSFNNPNQQGNEREKIPNACWQVSALQGNLSYIKQYEETYSYYFCICCVHEACHVPGFCNLYNK